MKRVIAILLLAALLLMLPGCSNDFPEDGTPGMVLGVIADLTPQKGEDGKTDRLPEDRSFYFGVQYAINEYVKEGQNGVKVRLVTYDLQNDKRRLEGAYEAFCEEQVDAILCLAKYASAVAEQASLDGIPVLVPDADERGLSLPTEDEDGDVVAPENLMTDYPNVYSLQCSPELFGQAAAFYLKLNSISSVAILTEENDQFFTRATEAFTAALEQYGIEITESLSVSVRDKDALETAVGPLLLKPCGMLFLSCSMEYAVELVYPAIYGTVYHQPTLLYSGNSDPLTVLQGEDETLQQSSLRTEARVFSSFSENSKRYLKGTFGKNFETLYGIAPERYAVLGYDGCSVLLQALRMAGDGEGALLQKQLTTMEFEGLCGTYTFDSLGYANRGFMISLFYVGEDWNTLNENVRFENFRGAEATADNEG